MWLKQKANSASKSVQDYIKRQIEECKDELKLDPETQRQYQMQLENVQTEMLMSADPVQRKSRRTIRKPNTKKSVGFCGKIQFGVFWAMFIKEGSFNVVLGCWLGRVLIVTRRLIHIWIACLVLNMMQSFKSFKL